ncbi:hypothetical protein [Mucilaginibacter lappiensis]|uniref:Phage tail tube protein n=1 Tax=Mucilaginibacter lappiensis TaxID=354630 RepID=A0A841JK17_9SPHI|nr:hypothetical protein [Mucilaginibacter lappiensis]MBB6131330.1 hypothetical protein [Mucilaginibacter lappiensis]
MATEKAINGMLYSWSDIRVNLLGRSLVGILAIDYSDSQDTKSVYGRGKKPIGRVSGNYKADGSITLEMSEVEALNLSLAPGTSIYDIPPFDVVVVYTNPEQLLVTHVLKGCVFTKQDRSSKSGDVKEIEVKLPLYITEIDWAA